MTLEKFEEISRIECKKTYTDLENGVRQKRLQKERDKVRALKDIIKGTIDGADLEESCLRSFGGILQSSATEYAKYMGAKIYKTKVGTVDIDTLFEYNGICYDLESKSNINLDKGKSRETKAELRDKKKVSIHSTRHEKQVISGIVVWTKPTEEEAVKLAKKSLKNQKMFGYVDFFKIFDVDIQPYEWKDMLRRVWNEEVRQKIYNNKKQIQTRVDI